MKNEFCFRLQWPFNVASHYNNNSNHTTATKKRGNKSSGSNWDLCNRFFFFNTNQWSASIPVQLSCLIAQQVTCKRSGWSKPKFLSIKKLQDAQTKIQKLFQVTTYLVEIYANSLHIWKLPNMTSMGLVQ